MKILEVRDGFIKFETEKKVSLSSFLQINGIEKRYIAQVIQTKRLESGIIAFAKILFLYDGTLKNYDKTLPSKDSKITEFTFDILNKSLNYANPVVAGKFIDEGINIPIDKECLNKKMLISTDNPKSTNIIFENLRQQFSNTLIIDMLGVIGGQKYTAGVDFKLPLNTDSLEFMYEDCLNDATSDSKSLIKEIFRDLSEYSQTVPFLPFGALKAIVDDMVDKSHIFKLLVLKNKLAKFDRLGCFASTQAEAENLKNILSLNNAVVDLSRLEPVFQNRYLSTIYSLLEKLEQNKQVFIEVSNSINKKNIKNIITNPNIKSVFGTHSRFKYINEIKSMFDNFIIEPSFTNNEVFKIYSTFLNSMPKDTYLLVGEGTNYIPFVSLLKRFEVPKPEILPEEISEITEEPELTEEDLAEIEEEEPQEEPQETILEEDLPKDSHSEAIEKKSEEIIEQAALEVENLPEQNSLFEDDEESEVKKEVLSESETQEDIDSVEEPEEEVVSFSGEEDFHTKIDEIQTLEVTEEISEMAEEAEEAEVPGEEEVIETVESEVIEEQANEDSEIEEIPIPDEIEDLMEEPFEEEEELQDFSETESEELVLEEQEPEVIPLSEEDSFDEIVELDPSELDDNDIIVDFTDEEDEDLNDPEKLDKEIVEDVDKVFTTIKDDSISDSDLDFIDELNSDTPAEELTESEFEELPEMLEEESEDGFLEPIEEINEIKDESEEEDKGEILETRNTSTPIVPVYSADIPQEDMVMSDPIEQGDTVTHAKYGTGVVEKMIKYGTKTLYSINFDNVGRRLLDPTLTEIKKA